MNQRPLTSKPEKSKPEGRPVSFCCQCGAGLRAEIPAGDNRLRYVCNDCAAVHYENPKLVVGCIPVFEDKVLICRRAIAPRRGFWTLPAGFMELGESMAQAAARETLEEACAEVSMGGLLASVNVPSAGQVHVFFRARLPQAEFAAGAESLEVKLITADEIPWDELAFTSNRIALEQHLYQTDSGQRYVWTGNAI